MVLADSSVRCPLSACGSAEMRPKVDAPDRSAYIVGGVTPSENRGSGGSSGPENVAHFEVIGRLGAGGMGVVYRARDTVLEREVALKLIRTEVAGEDELRHRFLREARLAAAINHHGVATLYEAGEAEAEEGGAPQLFLASELVEGRSRDARARALDFEPLVENDPAGLFIVAETLTLIGETDRAMETLVRAVEIGYNDPYYILVNPPMHGLQDRLEMEELAPY